MSYSKYSKRAALDRVTQALVEDILSATDEEILDEANDSDINQAETVAHLKNIFKRALAGAGKSRLAAAKAAVKADRRRGRSRTVMRLNLSDARARLEAVLKQHPATHKKLTLAARKGEGLSDADVQNMLEDFEELGILQSERNEDDSS